LTTCVPAKEWQGSANGEKSPLALLISQNMFMAEPHETNQSRALHSLIHHPVITSLPV